jgi:hypothetical protein
MDSNRGGFDWSPSKKKSYTLRIFLLKFLCEKSGFVLKPHKLMCSQQHKNNRSVQTWSFESEELGIDGWI